MLNVNLNTSNVTYSITLGLLYLVPVVLVVALSIQLYGILITLGLCAAYSVTINGIERIIPHKKLTYSGTEDIIVTNKISKVENENSITLKNNYDNANFIISKGLDKNIIENAKGTWRHVSPGQSITFKKKDNSIVVVTDSGEEPFVDRVNEYVKCVVFSDDNFVRKQQDNNLTKNLFTKYLLKYFADVNTNTEPVFGFGINLKDNNTTTGDAQ